MLHQFTNWLKTDTLPQHSASPMVVKAIRAYDERQTPAPVCQDRLSYDDLWSPIDDFSGSSDCLSVAVKIGTQNGQFVVTRYLLAESKRTQLGVVKSLSIAPLLIDNLLASVATTESLFLIAGIGNQSPMTVPGTYSTAPIPWIGPILTDQMLTKIIHNSFARKADADAVGVLRSDAPGGFVALALQYLATHPQHQWEPVGEPYQQLSCRTLDEDLVQLFQRKDLVVFPHQGDRNAK